MTLEEAKAAAEKAMVEFRVAKLAAKKAQDHWKATEVTVMNKRTAYIQAVQTLKAVQAAQTMTPHKFLTEVVSQASKNYQTRSDKHGK